MRPLKILGGNSDDEKDIVGANWFGMCERASGKEKGKKHDFEASSS